MILHIPTLLTVSIFIFGAMGLLTLHAWHRETRESALAYLGAMMLLAALGVLLFGLGGPEAALARIVVANMVLLLSAAMSWTSMRVFTGRPPSVVGIAAAPALWLILCFVPQFQASMVLRVFIYSLLAAAYAGLTLLELWRGRKKRDVSYTPALILTFAHAFFYCMRSVTEQPMGLEQARSGAGQGNGIPFFSFLLFESMMYVIGIAYVTLAMVKERVELRLKAAAYCDSLTEIGNRRAFMLHGEALLVGCKRRSWPAALLLCDLDHFKRLNDTFGHPMGDKALIAFSRIMAMAMRKQDVFARIGGEEFACLLSNTSASDAVAIAERIRIACSTLALLDVGPMSVSIGVASTQDAGYELSMLLSLADEALYAAKGKGRNQVQLALRPGAVASGVIAPGMQGDVERAALAQ